jgi:hypothetical protein
LKLAQYAKKKELQAAAVLRMYLFERIIERLSMSPYKNRFFCGFCGQTNRKGRLIPVKRCSVRSVQ